MSSNERVVVTVNSCASCHASTAEETVGLLAKKLKSVVQLQLNEKQHHLTEIYHVPSISTQKRSQTIKNSFFQNHDEAEQVILQFLSEQ